MFPTTPKEARLTLRRDLGPWSTMAVVVGVMIGSGIYLKPSEMAQAAGTFSLVMLAWIVGGLLSLFGALTFAELAAAIPESGGEYAYLRRGLGPLWGFLYGWRSMMVGIPASLAAYAASIMLFLSFFWPVLGQAQWSRPLGAVLILVFTAINYLRVRDVGRLQLGLTIFKVVALVTVVGVGLYSVLAGLKPAPMPASQLSRNVTLGSAGVSGFFAALTAALWAYSGWEDTAHIGGEVRDPGRNLPRALLRGFLFTTALYLIVNLGFFAVLGFQGVAGSTHVASDMLLLVAGPGAAAVFSVVLIVTVLGTMNGNILTASRIPYAMARDNLLFPAIAVVHPERRVPTRAVTLNAILAMVLVLTGTFADLSALLVFTSWAFYSLSALALFRLRRLEPDLPRPFRVPGYPWVPAVFFVLGLVLTVGIFLQRPLRSGIGTVIILLGIPVFRIFTRSSSGDAGTDHPSPNPTDKG